MSRASTTHGRGRVTTESSDDAVLVRGSSVVASVRLLLERAGLVVEPSAVLGVAAILEDREGSPAVGSAR